MSKKIFLIIAIIAIVAAAGYIIFSSQSTETPGDEERDFSFRSFFPFGSPPPEDSDDIGSIDDDIDSILPPETSFAPPAQKLREVSDEPVAGAVLLTQGTTTIVRYVLKDTGNVYEVRSNSTERKRLTNTTIAKNNRVVWLPSGEGFLSQKADVGGVIETFYVRLKPKVVSTSTELSLPYEPIISSLPTGIEELVASPDSRKIFYYARLQGGGMRSFISNPDGTSSASVYQSEIAEWLPTWYSASSILLNSKPSFNSDSVALTLNSSTRGVSKTFSGVVGGTSLPRADGRYILLSLGGPAPQLSLQNSSTGERSAVSVRTLTDKCAWQSPNSSLVICGIPKSTVRGSYPDSWYQGLITTNDTIHTVDVINNTLTSIVDPASEANEIIDVQSIQISKNGTHAAIINKLDQSLWLLNLE